MSSAPTARRLLTASGICALAVAGVVATAPSAGAIPGEPGVGCEPQDFTYICDGPIRADQTFERCRITDSVLEDRHLYLPRTEQCWIVHLTDNPVFGVGLPQHHIEP